MVDQIRKKNKVINDMIREISLKMKDMNIKTVDFDGDKPYITVIPKKILEIEAKKIYKTYEAEFTDLIGDGTDDKNINITSYLADEIDAHGYENEVTFASGTAGYISNIESESIEGIDKIENLNEAEKIENDLTLKDYITHLSLGKKQDFDFYLDSLPHEVMHSFGFKGGAIFEGVTETFSREVSNKYSIREVPIAHPDETRLAQKIEKVIGRDNLSKCSYFPSNKSNTLDLSNTIDSYINPERKGQLSDYEDMDNRLMELQKLGANNGAIDSVWKKVNTMYKELNQTYGEYIQNNPDKTYELGVRNKDLDDKTKAIQQRKFKEVSDIQDKEIQFLEYVKSGMENIQKNEKNSKNKGFDIEKY